MGMLILGDYLNVLLIDPGKVFLEKKTGIPKVYPHIGLAYIAACLLKENFDVKIIDMPAYSIEANQLKDIFKTSKPDVVGITAVTFLAPDAYAVATLVKEASPETTVVLGGAHATALHVEVLKECNALDIAVRGEGEYPMMEIARFKEEGNLAKKLQAIDGISYRRGKRIFVNNSRRPIENLDTLPFPRWDLFDYSKFKKVYSEKFQDEIALYQIAGSRGCPYQCTFCFPLHGREFRFRSPENVISEIETNHNNLGAKHFDFTDSTATVNRKRFIRICKLLMDTGLAKKVSWNVETRVDLVDKELLRITKKAGCELILFGLESADPLVLKSMKKNTSPMAVEKAVKESVKIGLKPKISVIMGHPFETISQAFRTFEFVKRLKKNYGIAVSYNIIDVYPGTELYAMVTQGKGGARWIEGAKDNWKMYDRTRAKIEVNNLTQDKIVQLYQRFVMELNQIPSLDFYKVSKER